jgi:hypothetical protein
VEWGDGLEGLGESISLAVLFVLCWGCCRLHAGEAGKR